MHGVYAKHHGREQNIVVDDCKITGFSGSGIRLDNAWVFNIRHSIIQRNQESGIDGTGSYDGWILDNQIVANGRGGIYGARFATVTITANRIEWNRGGGILLGPEGGNTIQIANCTFDRNYGPGIDISLDSPERITSANAITGNIFRRNGFLRDSEPEESVHLRLRNVKGVAVTGNTFFGGALGSDEAKKRPPSPRYGMILQNLAGCVVVNNSLYHAALEKVILDRRGHENTVIRDNPGSLRGPGFDPR